MSVKHPPPWLFVLTGLPYGVVGQFVGVVMPFATSHAKIEGGQIGWYTALLFIPTFVQVVYAPLIDIGPGRRHWLILFSIIAAGFLFATCLMPLPDSVTAYLTCAFFAQLMSGLVGSCNGGLMAASLPDELRGKAAGWYNIGNISGGGLAATLAVAMIGEGVRDWLVGALLAALMILPSLAALAIYEPPRVRKQLGVLLHENLVECRRVLATRAGLSGLFLCMSPVGTAALANSFSAMGTPYGVGPRGVALSTGLFSVLATALGAAVCGYLCDRFNRRVMYLASGGMTAVCGIVMALSARAPVTYLAGVVIYAVITGFCYASFTSTVLETIGESDTAAGTKYTLYVAAGNLAIAYVGVINTRFEARHGVEGVITSDATLNLVGVVALALVFWRFGAFGKWRHPAVRAADHPP